MDREFTVQGIEIYPGDESMNVKLVNTDHDEELRCATLTLIFVNPPPGITFGDKFNIKITKLEE